jgi:flavin reductase (DIM6/NTAB) family NADH-FMN oxidoreductase RutF
MKRHLIPVDELQIRNFHSWGGRWFLLTAGKNKPGLFNPMTVSWGSLGMLWDKPFAMVVVRPTRHTRSFMDSADSFTLCAFPEKHRSALTLCGSKSGRDLDKIKAAGITPIGMSRIEAPGFDEAEFILECRKMYFHDFDPTHFLRTEIHEVYPDKDYHRMYFGEILAVWGTDNYRSAKTNK